MLSVRYRHLVSIPLLMLATTAGAQSSDDALVELALRAAARLSVIQTPGSGPQTDLTLDAMPQSYPSPSRGKEQFSPPRRGELEWGKTVFIDIT